MANTNKNAPSRILPWLILPLCFSAFFIGMFSCGLQTFTQDRADTIILTQTHALTLAPLFCFLVGKRARKSLGTSVWFALYQPLAIGLTYFLVFWGEDFTLVFSVALFGWCYVWTLFSYLSLSANRWLARYKHYPLVFLPCLCMLISVYILHTAQWQSIGAIFLPAINTVLFILPALSFTYGTITNANSLWFLVCHALLAYLPLMVFLGYWWIPVVVGLAIVPWCLLWGFLGRRYGKKQRESIPAEV